MNRSTDSLSNRIFLERCGCFAEFVWLWTRGTAITAVVMLMLFVGWALPSEIDCERGDS